MAQKKKREWIDCPFCGREIGTGLFDSAASKKKLLHADAALRKKNGQPRRAHAQPLNVTEAYELYSRQHTKNMEWLIVQNEANASYIEILLLVHSLISAKNILPPENYSGDGICHVINDFWFVCFEQALESKRGENKRRANMLMTVEHNRLQNRYELKLNSKILAEDNHCLATFLRPVCPYCKKILPQCVLEITDSPIDISLLGDEFTGKTVWQVALMAYLQKKGLRYPIGNRCELQLPLQIDPRLERRMDAFLAGRLPAQTPQERIDRRNLRDMYNAGPYITEDTFFASDTNFADTGAKAAEDDRRASALLLILRQYTEDGSAVKSCRFVRIRDCAGENAKVHAQGVVGLEQYRSANALFLFADICARGGLESVRSFSENTMNAARPYVGLLIPKADLPKFKALLRDSLTKRFVSNFIRVLRFNLMRMPDEKTSDYALHELASLFADRFLHHSPEELAGTVCNLYTRRLEDSVLYGKPGDSVMQLYADMTDDAFCVRFGARNAGEWVEELCKKRLFDEMDPLAHNNGHSDDRLRRLSAAFYLRGILDDFDIDFDHAQKQADDLGIYPFSSLGACERDDLTFDIDKWKPQNLFDPLVGFLRGFTDIG